MTQPTREQADFERLYDNPGTARGDGIALDLLDRTDPGGAVREMRARLSAAYAAAASDALCAALADAAEALDGLFAVVEPADAALAVLERDAA